MISDDTLISEDTFPSRVRHPWPGMLRLPPRECEDFDNTRFAAASVRALLDYLMAEGLDPFDVATAVVTELLCGAAGQRYRSSGVPRRPYDEPSFDEPRYDDPHDRRYDGRYHGPLAYHPAYRPRIAPLPKPKTISDLLAERRLAAALRVGGKEVLDALDANHVEPLDDVPIDLEALTVEQQEIVGRVEHLAVGAVNELAPQAVRVEYRAAIRILLRRVLRRWPGAFAGVRAPELSANGLCWAAGRANGLLGPMCSDRLSMDYRLAGLPFPPDANAPERVFVKVLAAQFGSPNGASTIGRELLKYAGYTVTLAGDGILALRDTDILISLTRRRLALERDLVDHQIRRNADTSSAGDDDSGAAGAAGAAGATATDHAMATATATATATDHDT